MTLEEVREKIKDMNYMLTEDEVGTLYKYASEVPDNGIIMDIGTAQGGSALVMGLASKPNVKVHTIDPNRSERFFELRKQMGLEYKIAYHEKPSSEVASVFLPQSINLMFVDGIHNYWGVMNDFNGFEYSMKDDGIVIFHDYYLYDDTIGKAVDDIMESGRAEKIEITDSIFKNGKRIGMFVSKLCNRAK